MTTPDQRALCAEVDPEIFFPAKGNNANAARTICGNCTIRDTCLEDALTVQVHGIWAGTTPNDRILIRRQRGIIAPLLGDNARSPANHRDTIDRLLAQGLTKTQVARRLGMSGTHINTLLGHVA